MDRVIKIKVIEKILAGLFFFAIFSFFYFAYDYHLYFIEQLQIFTFTRDHILSYFSKPGFLSSMAGDFLTQFYYLKGGGPLVITLILILLWFLSGKLIRKITGNQPGFVLPLLPALFGWIALCDLEFPVAGIAGLILSVSATLIYITLRNNSIRMAVGVLLLPVLYWAAGINFLQFALVASLYELITGRNRTRILYPAIYLLTSASVPFLLKVPFHLTTLQAWTWIDEIKKNPDPVSLFPLISAILLFTLLLLYKGLSGHQRNTLVSMAVQVFIYIGILLSGIFLNSDFKLEKILKLDYKANHNRWQEVYDLTRKFDLKNNISTYYANMAMGRLGLMSDKLLDFYQPAATGLFIPVNADENYLTITFSNEVYWQLGDVNASQHSALLGMIFSPHSRNSRLMKRLAEINIVNGEYAVAGKYLNILGKTLFHRKWAAGQKQFLYNESACQGSDWIMARRNTIPVTDLLKKENEYKKVLVMLAKAHPDNRMAVDYLLCYDLLDKNITSFVDNFRKYYNQETASFLPQVYQEALLIEIASGRHSPSDFSSFRFAPENVKNMADYTALFDKCKGDGRQLKDAYGKTYWFYYHFAVIRN